MRNQVMSSETKSEAKSLKERILTLRSRVAASDETNLNEATSRIVQDALAGTYPEGPVGLRDSFREDINVDDGPLESNS